MPGSRLAGLELGILELHYKSLPELFPFIPTYSRLFPHRTRGDGPKPGLNTQQADYSAIFRYIQLTTQQDMGGEGVPVCQPAVPSPDVLCAGYNANTAPREGTRPTANK